MKRLIALVAVTAIAGAMLLPATNASAATVGGAVGACQVQLVWPGSGSAPNCGPGDLPVDGQAVGALLPGGPVCLPLCSFQASVDSYGEECFLNEPPLVGNANGTLFLNGDGVATYNWLRVGLVAVITVDPAGSSTVDAGAGVAAFVPVPPLGTCDVSVNMKAHVVGAVFAAQAP